VPGVDARRGLAAEEHQGDDREDHDEEATHAAPDGLRVEARTETT
jgi:hypothetical protein